MVGALHRPGEYLFKPDYGNPFRLGCDRAFFCLFFGIFRLFSPGFHTCAQFCSALRCLVSVQLGEETSRPRRPHDERVCLCAPRLSSSDMPPRRGGLYNCGEDPCRGVRGLGPRSELCALEPSLDSLWAFSCSG